MVLEGSPPGVEPKSIVSLAGIESKIPPGANPHAHPCTPEPVAASSSARSTWMYRSVGTQRGGGEAMVGIFDDRVSGYRKL